ncbi:MAG: hypothetical protein ACM3VS_16105 [Candidatus Dadabacteria bacterium]
MRQRHNPGHTRRIDPRQAFEQASDTGRFSSDDSSTRTARQQVIQNINRDDISSRPDGDQANENTDAEARRDNAQLHDYKGESQNVNDDTGRPLSEDELKHARNKSREGKGDEKP